MEIFIEDVTTAHQLREVSAVRREVFEKEWRLKTRQLQFDTQNKVWHLLARAADFGPAIGALSVVDTTADDTLHQNYALHFPENARVARLTQLAVLVSFRGRGIPYQLIREAIHQIVQPHRFDFTWLLFDASRAESCHLVEEFDYSVSPYVLQTEYGLCRVLSRDERRWSSRDKSMQAVDEPITVLSY